MHAKKQLRVWPGKPYPLGATWDGRGVNFALFSENATRVEICFFSSPTSAKATYRTMLPEKTHMIWHGYFPDIQPGQLYGYRVYGPYQPSKGLRFNSNKILLDPYAKALGRQVIWSDEMFGYSVGNSKEDLHIDRRNNSKFAPLAAVIDPAFTWGDDRKPQTPWHRTFIYEMHVKGFTYLNTSIPEEYRGKYLGVASDASIEHLKKLGVTAVELMPVHQSLDDRHLAENGLSNYWGYNTLSFFAPDMRYSTTDSPLEAVREFKTMVRSLHKAGIEVILDVVYNHTAEGSHLGPTLSFRGIDNISYYRLTREDKRFYEDFTGCGNTLNMRHPRVLQLIMDSLRYWVTEMHVDGFRFDLASSLARELYEVDKLSAFFDIIQQDPILSQVKLIAEPWDVGPGGYQVGNFPPGWAEWNGKYRDTIRSFWKGDGGVHSEFATRFCGSSDLYEQSSRRPHASINFVTSHDGFSLRDLVSYNDKHNEANKEGNRDGDSHNLSWNHGVEGETKDEKINLLRDKQRRNFLATLILSQGVPMLRSGDELSQTQRGNNNAYCQDNDISWINWTLNESMQHFLEYSQQLVEFWISQPTLQRRKFFQGRPIRGSKVKDIVWLDVEGREMRDETWDAGNVKCLGVLLAGDAINEVDETGNPIVGDTLMILLNAGHEALNFKLADNFKNHTRWDVLFDTSFEKPFSAHGEVHWPYYLRDRSVAVLIKAKS